MNQPKQPCKKCKIFLDHYYLKDGICNGCRNPHLIVQAVIHDPELEPRSFQMKTQKIAEQLSQYIYSKQHDNYEKYYLSDEAPHHLKQLVYELDKDRLPSDYTYDFIARSFYTIGTDGSTDPNNDLIYSDYRIIQYISDSTRRQAANSIIAEYLGTSDPITFAAYQAMCNENYKIFYEVLEYCRQQALQHEEE